ncbi:MAG: PhzF family phenazine biosynthesis protein [Pseudomonadota bacterium]|nr:PhzF family phenazine biosynthesis protein [Pseudomonadota bacterium]
MKNDDPHDSVLHYSAFTADGKGGNPAGVVLDARGMDDAAMQRVAADLGYSETAFLFPRADAPRDEAAFDIRYFSPLAEVSFCGHATIAATVAHAQQHGAGGRLLHTRAGAVRVEVDQADVDGPFVATLTSVEPRVTALDAADLEAILSALRWRREDLDPALAPAVAYAGASHPVIATATRARLAQLDYDFDALGAILARRGWITVNLVWRENATSFHARNPFPTGGVVEDPATGAAAAALGAYLADRRALPAGRAFTIRQGEDMGRPSRILVSVPENLREGVRVAGTAVRLAAD